MPSRKNRRQDPYPDWESSETDESCTNSHNHNIVDQAIAGGPSEHEESDGNGYTNNNGGAARPIQGKVSKSSQPKQKVTLGPWTLAVRQTLQSFDESQRNIINLQNLFTLHANNLERVDENSRLLHQLEEVCKQKDKEVERLEIAINTVTSINDKAKAQLEHESAQMEKERIELNQEKEKQNKRFATRAAEEKLKADKEFEKHMTQQEEICKKRKQELENEAALKRDETDRKAVVFKAETERLLATIKEQELQIKTQAQKLEKIEEDYDSLGRAKISIRKEKEDREAELIAVNKEFALDAQPMSYFVKSFEKIESEIGKISEKYFHSIEEKVQPIFASARDWFLLIVGKDFEKVREELGAADPIFKSVPIEDSDDSRDLCTAHAQRVISKAICEDIWKPFSSEFTALQPESSIFLGKISDEIDQSDHGGRTAKFWNARTMRALKSLRADSVASRDSESSGCPYPTRTGSVISKVFVISSLFDSSQNESLRKDLVSLVNSAVEVWDNVQAGGSKITVSLLLDRAYRERYPPKQFDPTCEGDETNQDLTSTTHSRIFPLFPRVLAPAVEDSEKHGNGLPGSWPADSNLIVIHPGKGLPDWSPLVVRGKETEEERKDLFRTGVENLKKQLQSTKRGPGNGRRSSRGSVSSGTPSEQWKSRGAIEFIEN